MINLVVPILLIVSIIFHVSLTSHQPCWSHITWVWTREETFSTISKFVSDEFVQCRYRACRLVAKTFDSNAHLLNNDDLPLISETYIHLLIASFMLTLSSSQRCIFQHTQHSHSQCPITW
jgi:hypothetical protein